jgi:transcriptional regulator with XRE-family HTH domain
MSFDCDEQAWRRKFGDKIKRLIHIRNMTQGQVAEELGISEVTLSRYITGTCMPDPYRLQQIAYMLDYDMNCLFDVDN